MCHFGYSTAHNTLSKLSFVLWYSSILQVLRSDGKATFSIDPNRAAAAALDMLGGLFTGEHATISKMPPGAYNMTATYNGDGIYPPATAFAKLLISPTCLFTTIVLS